MRSIRSEYVSRWADFAVFCFGPGILELQESFFLSVHIARVHMLVSRRIFSTAQDQWCVSYGSSLSKHDHYIRLLLSLHDQPGINFLLKHPVNSVSGD